MCCDAQAHCLELLWQKCCGFTAWTKALNPSLYSLSHTLPKQERPARVLLLLASLSTVQPN